MLQKFIIPRKFRSIVFLKMNILKNTIRRIHSIELNFEKLIRRFVNKSQAHRTNTLSWNRMDSRMMTHARKKMTVWNKRRIMRIPKWIIRSFNTKDQKIIKELEDHKKDICAFQETKKKGKGQRHYGRYIVVYSGVDKNERAKEGVAIALHMKYQ